MTKGILGRKLGMTQMFSPEGLVYPVTVIEAGPCVVLQKKNIENDGYEAIQIGFDDKKEKNATKPELGHAKKANAPVKRFVREIRGANPEEYELGQELKADIFAEGEYVDVTATSKGKGFAGVIKRHGQARGPMSHGSKYHRGIGSMAVIRTANRIPKGKKMPGRMGSETVTIQNLEIVKVDAERNIIVVKGSIPGPKNGYVKIKSAVKKKQQA
ncbi:50S ribosomal protein L3 [Insulibacter thermoxylanivorax]|uniref:Large ribosomal subunit protein uL3 n=1 Tax=Insulibacter thermoxylanivorax TaxID=2749268 RepID=A0A916QI36_9BACL|nr:50S ribosomal protein L3 [Insulibacter thermoxylanivorax]GFR38851.1 50S ribosomal protein L3 [Insulibacter thermoxylanivorax]